jgi:hypothetical protein
MADRLKRWWPALLLLIAAATGIAIWRDQHRDYAVETARDDQRALATVITASFARTSALKVATLKGTMQVPSSDPGALPILRSDQVIKVPFAVDYFIDASRLSLDDYIYDPATKTLQVRAPDVTVAEPNIDESRRSMVRTRGMFVTRGASERLATQSSTRARQLAQRESGKPERLAQARASARAALAGLLATPLAAAGMGDVRVSVVMPGEIAARRPSERWDVSRSIGEVLREREGR